MSAARRRWILGASLALLALAVVVPGLRVSYPAGPWDLKTVGGLPVLNGGRTKPLDSVARNALLLLSGKQTLRTDAERRPAIAWLLDVMFDPKKADTYAIVEIDDPDVLGLMGIEQTTRRRFTVAELRPHFAQIEAQADRANELKPEDRGRFETALLALYEKLMLYQKLANTLEASGTTGAADELRAMDAHLPRLFDKKAATDANLVRAAGELVEKYRFMNRAAAFLPIAWLHGGDVEWKSAGQAGIDRMANGAKGEALPAIAAMGDAYRAGQPNEFNTAAARLAAATKEIAPKASSRARAELVFNHAEPFYRAMSLYVLALLLAVFSWLGFRRWLAPAAHGTLAIAFLIHTAGLVSRMILQGRPPVTNLYSSAIFVGWAAVLLGLLLERVFRYGIATVVSSLIGFCTLIIAHHLATQGDTLEMMRAVLDSNFWLATHVVTITVGYSSTFLAGFLGVTYIARRLWLKGPDREARAALERMVYGVVCFSTFFSFLGTVLGGIWADQSWGRFWGWDPKENGALMIVLWNAFILHARIGRMADERTVMALAVFGNVVTALSWFGVNMLGIGLHSYGFMDKAFAWLLAFCLIQFVIIAAAYAPAGAMRRSRPKL